MNNKNMDDLGKMADVNKVLASYQMYAEDTIQRIKMKEALLNEDPPSPARSSSRRGIIPLLYILESGGSYIHCISQNRLYAKIQI